MRLSRLPHLTLLTLAIPLVASSGCGGGGGASVSGTVTYNGQPVDKGTVTFFPVDGKASGAGGEIHGGKFTVKNVAPGKNRVLISSQPKTQASDSMGDPKKPTAAANDDSVSADAEGNNQVVEIAPGGPDLQLKLLTMSHSGPPLPKK